MKRSIAPSTNLVLSLRDMGYTLETALADVIDNSISAGATRVDITSPPTTPLRITITDNGRGMSADEILAALTLADMSPVTVRTSNDLGRYGMGMKTASWSQCKRLTVVSRTSDGTAAAVIDLDELHDGGDWIAEFLDEAQIENISDIESLPQTGTMIVWEKLDRIAGSAAGDQQQAEIARKLNIATEHLGRVFHRFMTPEPGHESVSIWLNGRKLDAIDLFLSKHPSTQELPEESIRVDDRGVVKIKTYTLPHHSKASAEETKSAGGSDGFLMNQGFYLYRERRLIRSGGWFGLTKPHPSLNLTRVRVDIPNTMDDEWRINIIKASAQPPRVVRDRLKQIIDAVGRPSRQIYRQRGYVQTDKALHPVWVQRRVAGQVHYEVSFEHPLVKGLSATLDEEQRTQLRAVLKLINASLPVDALMASLADDPSSVKSGEIGEDDLKVALDFIWAPSHASKVSALELVNRLRSQDPFKSHIAFVAEYLNEKERHGPV